MMKRIVFLLLLVFAVSSANASLMDFDVATTNGDGFNGVLPNYGNRIASAGTATVNMTSGAKTATYAAPGAEGATPNIATDSAALAKYYSSGYGDLADVAYASVSGDAEAWLYGFIPDAGYQTKFHSLDIGRWGAGTESNYVQIKLVKASDWTTVVWDSGLVAYPVDASAHINIAIDYTSAVGEELWLKIKADDTDLYAVDNLVISQVPEPATIALLGFGALAAVRKRK